MKDYYYILGVKPDATATEIKAAYRKLAMKFHPDKNNGDTFFEERFKEIQEAHETLIDPSSRQRYDNSRNPNTYQKPPEPPKAEKPIPPLILSFSINKTALSSAEEFTVSWQTLNAETVTIQPFNIQVDANGNKNFRIPKLDSKLETIKIELIAQNRFGNVLRTVVLENLEWVSPVKEESVPEENILTSFSDKAAEWFWLIFPIVVSGLFLWGLITGGIFIYDKVTGKQQIEELYVEAVDSTAAIEDVDTFVTASSNATLTDIDGNTYKTTTIGNQTWMAENLRTTKYNDGNSINLASSDAKMCYYDNSISNKATFGALYNWLVVNTGKLCPIGWHVSTDEEWTTLTDYLGGDTVAGLKLKASSGWNSDTNGTDEVGFNALPGGYRDNDGTFLEHGNDGYWWTASSFGSSGAGSRFIYGSEDELYRTPFSQGNGFSVRCIKD